MTAPHTGWPAPMLLQDSSRPLFKWFADKADSRRHVRDAIQQMKRKGVAA